GTENETTIRIAGNTVITIRTKPPPGKVYHNPGEAPVPFMWHWGTPCAMPRQAPDARVTRAIRRRRALSCGVFSLNANAKWGRDDGAVSMDRQHGFRRRCSVVHPD